MDMERFFLLWIVYVGWGSSVLVESLVCALAFYRLCRYSLTPLDKRYL